MDKKIFISTIIIVFMLVITIIFGYYFTNQSHITPKPIQSVSNFYLDESRIFVLSANASYGDYPYSTVTSIPIPPSIIAKHGEPCVIINVTLRNDYSAQYPAPNPVPYNATSVYVALTANLYSNETKINAKDITNAFPIASVSTNKAFAELNYGESTSVTIYLATNSYDVTSFQLVPGYIGELLPP